MTSIALFHSVLGVRSGIEDAAARLRGAGHIVTLVDQYDGKSFVDYESAGAHAASIGFPELMRRALDGVAMLPDGFADYVKVSWPRRDGDLWPHVVTG
jgi:dienelactone hydrolase